MNGIKIITREAARAQGLKRYFTGKPCKHGHVEEREVLNAHCLECHRKYERKQRAANLEKERVRERKWREDNPEKVRERKRKSARRCRATPLGRLRKLCVNTAERLELGKLDHSKLKLLGYGPDEYIAHLEATLPNGMTFTEARAAGYHVDHIVPLAVINDACPMDKAGRLVAFRMASDLANLQMLSGAENMNKHASFDTAGQRSLFDLLCARYRCNSVAN